MADANKQLGGLDAVAKALEGADKMATPDLTKAQLIAVVQAIVAALVLLGKPPGDDVVTAAVAAISALVLIMLPTSDALIRRERARNAVAIADAKRLLRPAPAGMLRESLEDELDRLKEGVTATPTTPATAATSTTSTPTAGSEAGGTSSARDQQTQSSYKN